RQIVVATELTAPKEGQSRGRISWLLRQLQKAPPDLTIDVRLARTAQTLSANLDAIRADPSVVLPDRTREIRGFRLSLRRDAGLNRQAGRGSFIDGVLGNVKTFYGDCLQQLTAWKPRAPKLRAADRPIERDVADVPEPIEEALVEAEERMADAAE
ncbi:MAG: hypothetical protein ACRDG7_09140, partial [Candidatus Limnocylindria bacterium]